MIKYDPSRVSIDFVRVKSLTTAGGGSIRVVDETRSTDNQEIYRTIKVPMAIVRAYVQAYGKISKYITPVWTAVATYDGQPFALERHPAGGAGALVDASGNWWKPNMERAFALVNSHATTRQWYFDGRYVYTLAEGSPDNAIRQGEFLSQDGKFRTIDVEAWPLHKAFTGDGIAIEDRTCVAFVASNGEYEITPPIWKDVRKVRGAASKQDDEDTGEEMFTFDEIDNKLSVNLNFALQAAKKLSSHFGYEVVEAVDLPSLMVALNTVNLPNVEASVRSTYSCGMSYKAAFAWLLRYLRKAKTLDEEMTVRAQIKYLTSKGLFFQNLFAEESIFKTGRTLSDVPVMNRDGAIEAMQHLRDTDPNRFMSLIANRRARMEGDAPTNVQFEEDAMDHIMTGDDE